MGLSFLKMFKKKIFLVFIYFLLVFSVTQKKLSKLRTIMTTKKPCIWGLSLPLEVEQLIYEFDPTFRIVFDSLVQTMNRLVLRDATLQPELQFKKKFRHIGGKYNNSYRIVYDKYCPCGYFRIASVYVIGDCGFGTLLLKASVILMTMEEKNQIKNLAT
jgi:hypothetical protein